MCNPTFLVVDKVPSQIVCRRFSLGQSNDYHSTVSSIQTSCSQSFKDHPIPMYFSDAFLQQNMDKAMENRKNTTKDRKKGIFTGWWKIRKSSRRDSATQIMDESHPKQRVPRRLTM